MTSAYIQSLSDLNEASMHDALTWFMQTCTSQRWCSNMTRQRPFENLASLQKQAAHEWQKMTDIDFIEAFSGHPMIGDMNTLRKKYASTKALASEEQSGAKNADEATLRELQQLNQAYLNKHGFIFIICATGLSANEMLEALKERLPNSNEIEIEKAAKEQIKITLLRIHKAFENEVV